MVLYIVLLLAACLASRGGCDPNMGFVFPPNATQGSGDQTAANLTVHFNDNITLEYNLPDTDGQIWLYQNCYSSIKAASSEEESSFENSNSCKLPPASRFTDLTIAVNNTGALHWSLGNGNAGNYTGINVCRFAISNYTI